VIADLQVKVDVVIVCLCSCGALKLEIHWESRLDKSAIMRLHYVFECAVNTIIQSGNGYCSACYRSNGLHICGSKLIKQMVLGEWH